MSGNSVVLDTSVAIAVLAGQVGMLLSSPGSEFILPAPVICELRHGALNSRRSSENLAEVERLMMSRARHHGEHGGVYARLRLGFKSKGKPISENDLFIAAACVEHQVPLVTLDAHFDVVDGLERIRM